MDDNKIIESNKDILVSIVVLTYNHEKYIKAALDSIIMQEVNFNYEILVGDDNSTDNTPKILKEYKKKYPERIKLILRNKNLGGTKNSYDLFTRAQSKYIALLEGDDYWTDPKKLQKQIDVLENNESYSACGCDFKYIDEFGEPYNTNEEKLLRNNLYSDDEVFTLAQFNHSKLPSHAGTLVYRNIFKMGVDGSIIYRAHPMIGDFTVILLILSRGNIYKIAEEMSCYRLVRKGSSWSASESGNPFLFYETFRYYNTLEVYAKGKLSLHVDLRNIKQRFFFDMLLVFYNHPTKARMMCVLKMIKLTTKKWIYVRMLVEALYPASIPPTIIRALTQKETIKNTKNTWESFELQTSNKDIVLVGAGGGCEDLLEKYYHKYKIKFVVDNAVTKQGKYIYGYKVFSPDILSSMDPEKTAVIITVLNLSNELIAQCKKYGMKYCYSFCEMECNRRYYSMYKKYYLKKVYISNQ